MNSYYPIYQAERCKTAAETRTTDARNAGLAAALGEFGLALAAPVRAARRSLRRQQAGYPAASDAG